MSHAAEDAGAHAGPITPFPVPPGARQVLLFGGLFDPPHLAHTALGAQARDMGMGPEAWLVFVPAAKSPLKSGTPGAADHDRVRMLELASRGLPRTAVWTDEIDRARAAETSDPSYWINTLQRARQVAPVGAVLRFLIGADQALQFHRWRSYREILQLAEPLVMPRPPIGDAGSMIDGLRRTGVWAPAELDAWRGWVVPVAVADPSSTRARELLMSGHPEAAAQLLDPAVFEYIQARGLYR